MSEHPHSLLEAVKITAQALGLEWSVAHRYYRELQGDPKADDGAWLPKSLGRNIWLASPPFIARFLIALGSSDTADKASENVAAINTMTPDGRERGISEKEVNFVERAIAKLLIDPDYLATLDRIEFDPADNEVQFIYKNGTSDRYTLPGSKRKWQLGFYWRGVITASVLETIASEVRWRTYADAPLSKVRDGAVDPEP